MTSISRFHSRGAATLFVIMGSQSYIMNSLQIWWPFSNANQRPLKLQPTLGKKQQHSCVNFEGLKLLFLEIKYSLINPIGCWWWEDLLHRTNKPFPSNNLIDNFLGRTPPPAQTPNFGRTPNIFSYLSTYRTHQTF